METVVRKFNRTGLLRFEDLLRTMRDNPKKAEWGEALKKEIDILLFDDTLSGKFGDDYFIDRSIQFENRYSLGKYLYSIFENRHLEKETGLLSWLALIYLDQICDKKGQRNRLKVLSTYRYIPEVENSRRFYRHLILTPLLVWQQLKEEAILLLSNPLYESGDAVEQWMSRRDFIANKTILKVAKILYFDEARKKPKVRAFTTSEPGNAIRLAKDIVPQLSMTYDLYEAPVDQVISLLPNEFGEWIL